MTEGRFPADCRARYQPIRRPGVGGFGEVWLARHRELERGVAVKLLHAQLLADELEVGRFRDEARITASLNHPGIVKVHDQVAAGRVTGRLARRTSATVDRAPRTAASSSPASGWPR